MTQDSHPNAVAVFRYSILSQVFCRVVAGEAQAVAVHEVAARSHARPVGDTFRRVSERSIYRWLRAYDQCGIAGLEPKRRDPLDESDLVLPSRLLDFMRAEKKLDRAASIPELIRRARELGILEPQQHIDRSTVYRVCLRLGLPVTRVKQAKDRDARRFAHPHRMDMVLCDGKHFRAGTTRKKRVVLFFIDDATRLILHAVVGTSETGALFQRGLYECLCKHGFMSALYIDRGPGFIARDTAAVLTNLGIPWIHGETGYKEGRGKVERFNRTANADLLRAFDRRPDVDPGCRALELRIRHYADKIYAHRVHGEIWSIVVDGKMWSRDVFLDAVSELNSVNNVSDQRVASEPAPSLAC